MIGEQSRNQEYTYQYKTVSVRDAFICGHAQSINIAVPKNLIAIKNVFMHVYITYDVAVPIGQRKLDWVGGAPVYINFDTPAPKQPNMRYVGIVADPTTRIIDAKIDITDLISKLSITTSGNFDQPYVSLNLLQNDPTGLFNVTGTMKLWKIDLIYTTQGTQ